MVNSSNLTGIRAEAADLEKGENWEEDLEEREICELEEGGDVEKRVSGAVYVTAEPNLLEPLLTPEEAQHEGLAAASTPLVPTAKIIVSLVVICFVLVEAYFVGRSFRNWINTNEHLHNDDGKIMNKTEFAPRLLPLKLQVLAPIARAGGVKESISGSAEPFGVTSDGRLDSEEVTVRESSEAPLMTKMSTRMSRLPPGVDSNSQSLVLPLMDQDAPISAYDAVNGEAK